jgi:hypothetical protein
MIRAFRLLCVTSIAGTVALAASPGCGGTSDTSIFDAGPGSSSSGASGSSGESSSGFGGVDDAGTSSSGFNVDAACAATSIQAKVSPANILFLVDRSGSMNCNPPPTTTSTRCEQFPVTEDLTKDSKWKITREALKSALASMPATNSAGVSYFNNNDDCGVQSNPNVAVAAMTAAQKTALNTSLDAVTPKGYTPIVGGVTLGYQYLHTQVASTAGKKFLVLITDGEETCAKDQEEGFIETTVKNATLVGIRTFVIGAPGSEDNRAQLSRIAFNGLTPKTATCVHASTPTNVGNCHFDLSLSGTTLATDLNNALAAISKETLGCEYDVPTPTSGMLDYGKVNVIYKPGAGAEQTIPQDNSKGCDLATGWQYSADKKKIILCGSVCTAVKADSTGSVSIALGCGTIVTR